MRVVYLGAGDIGLPALRWLIAEDSCDLVGVFTQPDKPFGRKLKMTPPQVKIVAQDAGIPVVQPEKLRDPSAMEDLRALRPDLIVVMAYGQILKRDVIELPTIACINLHASILPRHRGASPIQAAIRDGDVETGITVMYVDVGLDTGDILLAETCEIAPDETGGSLHDKLADLAPTALAHAVSQLAAGNKPRTPQSEADSTYLGKLSRSDGELDFSRPAGELERLIRAFDPWPGAYTRLELRNPKSRAVSSAKLKIFPQTRVVAHEPGFEPGTVQTAESSSLVVACGEGALALSEVQLEGRKRLPIDAFIAGHGSQIQPGTRLGG